MRQLVQIQRINKHLLKMYKF